MLSFSNFREIFHRKKPRFSSETSLNNSCFVFSCINVVQVAITHHKDYRDNATLPNLSQAYLTLIAGTFGNRKLSGRLVRSAGSPTCRTDRASPPVHIPAIHPHHPHRCFRRYLPDRRSLPLPSRSFQPIHSEALEVGSPLTCQVLADFLGQCPRGTCF